jgi:hypothetical protein
LLIPKYNNPDMDTPAIRDIAIDAAEKYFQYLDRNGKGLQEVEISDIVPLENKADTYRLRLSAKLFDIESIFFKLYPNNRLVPVTEIKVVEYDAEKNLLWIKPNDELQPLFRRLPARDISVISDLKFLIERVKKWYELCGGQLSFPVRASPITETLTQIRYLPGLEPSDHQKAAIQLIFQAPFAYIWGAPGTGKTQFVLSYSVLHYLAHKKRVAIMAPTNNAIEQVLRGVLKMLDVAGVARTKILRLGVPSRRFAEEYPEVCEERGVMKKLEELDKQIDRFRNLLDIARELSILEYAQDNLYPFLLFPNLEEKLAETRPELENSRENYLTAQAQIERLKNELQQADTAKESSERKIHSLGHRMGRWFSSKPSKVEIDWRQAIDALPDIRVRMTHWQKELGEKEGVFDSRKKEVFELEQRWAQAVRDIKAKCSGTKGLQALLAGWNGQQWQRMKTNLENQIRTEWEVIDNTEGIYQEYKYHQLGDLKREMEKLQVIRQKMETGSTEERLKEVSVIACTLDGYIGRFTETRLEVDHVFLDEAGYANISKALTLFSTGTPVTFLGDHMQLPPVCEINDQDIRENAEYNNVFLWGQSAIYLEGLFQKARDILLLEYLKNTRMVATRMQQANLIHTFRFGRRLAAILDAHVYENGFASSLEQGDTRIYYVHAPKTEQRLSRTSAAEVQAVRQLVEHFVEDEDFVILTPYRKQVNALGKALPRERNELKILTVHASQGREWDTVILSVVDTADKWFVDSRQPLSNGLNLLNTAVSRTKKRLIIVCDHKYWATQHGQLVTDLLSTGEVFK